MHRVSVFSNRNYSYIFSNGILFIQGVTTAKESPMNELFTSKAFRCVY